ncbi:MAG: radical SAM protein [Candidatus Aenigmarchaeota archaeon]|nr:radical SAM protein [Candidatus Aenigmarchaeota archaeon]
MFELYLLRPDTINALDKPMIKRILPRYVKVVNDQAIAKFQVAKRIKFEIKRNMSIEDLWKAHSNSMKQFYRTIKDVDKGKIKLNGLKKSEFSLLDLKIRLTEEIMKSCELCERKCHVNRLKGKLGNCRVGKDCLISSEHIHLGEEAHISPSHTIFFMGCNFHCQYCQNWSISQWFETGYEISSKELALRIERRRKEGCRNVNYVGASPTPSLLWVLESLKYCNVNVPVIWNSNFYMTLKTMKILDGIVDMYLPDFKYGNDKCALRLSKVPNYFEVVSRNHLLAARQAEVTVRHLILPSHLECCTFPILNWIANNIKEKCIVNLMDQFTPHWRANEYPEINRRITEEEFIKAVNYAKKLNINYIT